jgi:hypothetical protein
MYHCLPYNREFIDVQMAKEHIEYTWPRDYAAETLKADRVLGKALEVDVSYSDPADQPFFGTCNREIHKVVAISDHIAMPHEEATTN